MTSTKRTVSKTAREAMAKVDWLAIRELSDEDIARQIASNPDAGPDTSRIPVGTWRRLRPIDVCKVRKKIGLTQREFAVLFGIEIATLRNWEQGRREPTGPARALLNIIDHEPEAVLRSNVLHKYEVAIPRKSGRSSRSKSKQPVLQERRENGMSNKKEIARVRRDNDGKVTHVLYKGAKRGTPIGHAVQHADLGLVKNHHAVHPDRREPYLRSNPNSNMGDSLDSKAEF